MLSLDQIEFILAIFFCCYRDGNRPKNFRVRVYRNGDDSVCAYCASCSMDIVSYIS